jgi:hypothetical protein
MKIEYSQLRYLVLSIQAESELRVVYDRLPSQHAPWDCLVSKPLGTCIAQLCALHCYLYYLSRRWLCLQGAILSTVSAVIVCLVSILIINNAPWILRSSMTLPPCKDWDWYFMPDPRTDLPLSTVFWGRADIVQLLLSTYTAWDGSYVGSISWFGLAQ